MLICRHQLEGARITAGGPRLRSVPLNLEKSLLATTGGIREVAGGWIPDGRRRRRHPWTKPLYCSHITQTLSPPRLQKNPSAPCELNWRIHHPDTHIEATTIMTRLRDGSRDKMALEPLTFVPGSIIGNEAVSGNCVVFFVFYKNFTHSDKFLSLYI